MKKNVIMLLLFVSGLLFPMVGLAATCDYSEQNRLNGLGANVRADYVVKTRKEVENVSTDETSSLEVEFEYSYFTLNIYNVTNEMRVVVNNKTLGTSITYYFADANDGIISFDSNDTSRTYEFEILVYSYNTEFCNDILLSTKIVRLPRTNRYSDYEICKEAEGFYLCQEFLSSDYDVDDFEFFSRVNEYLSTIDEDADVDKKDDTSGSFWVKAIDFIGKYWYYFASGVIMIGLIVGIVVAIRVRRRDI